MVTLFQFGEVGTPTDYAKFFQFPAISLQEMREWLKDNPSQHSIGLGAVVSPSGTIAGEMVMIGGTVAYMVGSDGQARIVPEDHKIIFAQIGFMEPHERHNISATNLADLKQKLSTMLASDPKQKAFMVRIHGTFPSISMRGVDTKGESFSSLATLLKRVDCAKSITHENSRFELSGFYSAPGAVDTGVTLEDTLHLHGISPDHTKGGHLNDFNGPATLEVEIMPITQWLTATREAHEQSETQPWTNRWANRLMQCQESHCAHSR